jgi:hypothetical protein
MTKFLNDSKRWLPGVVVSLIFIYILYRAIDWQSALDAILKINPWFLLLHGIFYFVMLIFRAFASRALLENRPSSRDSFVVMMQGYLLNNVLPFRLGELGRAYLLGRKTGLGTANALPAIVIERFYDLAFAAIILVSTLPFVLSDVSWARPVAYSTLTIVGAGLLSLHLVARYRVALKVWIDRIALRFALIEKYILPQIDAFLDGLAVLTNPRLFLASLFWMAMTWTFAVIDQYVLLLGLMPNAPLLYSTFAMGASAFAGAIPSAPSSLGVLEGAVVGAFAILNADKSVAFALAIIHHIAHIIYSGAVGFYGFSRDDLSLMDMYEKLSKKETNQE